MERLAALMGMAKPTPSAVPDSLLICALMPMTSPPASNIGPPELPRLIGASVWIASTRLKSEVIDGDRPLGSRDDAHAQRAHLLEGAPDRGDRLADDDRARIAERHRVDRMVCRVDLEQPDVVEDIPPDDLGGDPLSVPELHVDRVGCYRLVALRLARGRDNVGVGENVALVRDDETGALRGGGAVEAAFAEDARRW